MASLERVGVVFGFGVLTEGNGINRVDRRFSHDQDLGSLLVDRKPGTDSECTTPSGRFKISNN